MANVFQKVQPTFGDGSVRERKGEEKKQQGRLEKSDELVLGWKFQTGEKKERERERWGLGWISRFPLREKRLEAPGDPRERGSQTSGLVAFSRGQGYFCFRTCLPSLPLFRKAERVAAAAAAAALPGEPAGRPEPSPLAQPHYLWPAAFLLSASPCPEHPQAGGSEEGFLSQAPRP